MLASQLLAKARPVRLPGHGATDSALAGQYRSAFRGSGMEFEESREYAPGDDAAAIDWKVTARMGRPFVKRFREERERTVMLAVDVSRSMTVAGPGGPPLVEAAAVAAVTLAVSAGASRDRVGLVLFSERVEAFVPPAKGPGRAVAVAVALAGTVPTGAGTDPAPAMQLLSAALTHRSVIFVFSDFVSPGFDRPLGRLARQHEVTVVRLAGPQAEVLPPYGLLTVSDLETGARATLDCGDRTVRERYAATLRDRRARTLKALGAAGADILELPADAPPAPALEAFFRRRGRGRRGRRPAG